MANTYSQIHIHAMFSVQNRFNIITHEWEDELYKYITGIVHQNKNRLLAIGGMPDHIHLLIGLRPTQSISEIMQIVKANSSKWINERQFIKTKFSWQEGFGAFSHSKSDLPRVIRYVNSQEEHHKIRTFKEEYLDLLKEFDVAFDERYIFRPVDYEMPGSSDREVS
jgi:putative transposase